MPLAVSEARRPKIIKAPACKRAGAFICRVPPIHHRCHLNRCGVSPGNPNKPRAIRGRRLSGLIALGILPAS